MMLLRRSCIIAAILLIGLSVSRPAQADQIRDQEWIVSALKLREAQRIATGKGVVVAVIDSGVRYSHRDLIGNVLPGVDLASGVSSGFGNVDVDGHGTAMASLIAGHGHDESNGILGIAPAATIMPIRDGVHQPKYLAAAISWAVDHRADIISISQGQQSVDSGLIQAVDRAVRAGIVVVAAAGNRPEATRVEYPAALPGVLAVGGTDRQGKHYSASVTGPSVGISAPADNIVAAYFDGEYAEGSGTSSATAIVAGAAALVRQAFPGLAARDVLHRLEATAIDKGLPGRDDEFGYGLIDIVAALSSEVSPIGGPDIVGIPPSAPGRPEPNIPPSNAMSEPRSRSGAAKKSALLAVGALVVVAAFGCSLYRRRRRGWDWEDR